MSGGAPQADRPGDDDPGRGRRLGLDVGTVRIGVSLSDPDGILATPLETVDAKGGDPAALDRIGFSSRRTSWSRLSSDCR